MFRPNPNRRCYNGYYVPIDTMFHYSWPPTYVTCDCGKLAKHIVEFSRLKCGAPHFKETRVWKCSACNRQYRLAEGAYDFETVIPEED